MITMCSGCQTRYRLDDAKVPQRLIRVRCPRCQAVFLLDGAQAAARVEKTDEGLVLERAGDALRFGGGDQVAAKGARTPARAKRATVADDLPSPPAGTPGAVDDSSRGKPSRRPLPADTEAKAADNGAVAVAGTGRARRRGRSRDKTRMLARALVSDILVYNRDVRDKALQEGKLLEALGSEIKKSWELYKEKVTPEVANSTTHFRDALNEILAEGQKVF